MLLGPEAPERGAALSFRAACNRPLLGKALADELAARADDQPAAAVFEDVLAEDLAGAAVADVVVERPPGVGDLAPAVLPLGRPEQRALESGADPQRPLRREVRRPRLCARAVTRAAGS